MGRAFGGLIILALLQGCSTMSPEERMAYVEVNKQRLAKNTLVIDCPTGCNIEYTDPRDSQIVIPQEKNGYDLGLAVINGLVGMAPYAAGVMMLDSVVDGFSSMQGDVITTDNSRHNDVNVNRDIDTTVTGRTTTVSGSGNTTTTVNTNRETTITPTRTTTITSTHDTDVNTTVSGNTVGGRHTSTGDIDIERNGPITTTTTNAPTTTTTTTTTTQP